MSSSGFILDKIMLSLDEIELDESGGEEDEGEIIDWQLPLCFMKKRHRESIEGASPLTQSWKMKERVRCKQLFILSVDLCSLLW